MASDPGATEPAAAGQNWWQDAIRSGTGQAIRWLAVLGLLLWRWAEGWPSAARGWIPLLAVIGLLLLPDADTVAFGGVKIEMRRAREEISGLKQQIALMNFQSTTVTVPVVITTLATTGATSDATERQVADDVVYQAPEHFGRPR